MDKIDISSELERLDKHLAGNKRTILSAKFGDGKSYFLKDYVNTRGNEKLFITLHPVNYVVAPNEDVFEYIKRDILKELCQYRLVTDDVLKSILSGVVNKDNALSAVGFLAQVLLPAGIGEAAKNLLNDFVTNYKKNEISVQSYFSGFTNQRGGIYEEDAYTVMIKETVQHVQTRAEASKQVVLIIEDLDRIDPGHLFRILNVLGAHIDVDPDKNKFGFDNIILVLDYDVTRHVFHHLYGMEANYEGYMNKFIGDNVFHYSVTEQARQQLINFLENECKLSHELMDGVMMEIPGNEGLTNVGLPKYIEKMSVRDVKRVLDNIEKKISVCTTDVNGYTINTDAPILRILSVLVLMNSHFDLDHIVRRWSNCYGTLELMGVFLAVYPDINKKAIVLKNEATGEEDYWAIRVVRYGENNQIQFYRTSPAAARSEMRIHELLYRAISEATNFVIDCPQLPEYDKELEEKIYYAENSHLFGLPDEE